MLQVAESSALLSGLEDGERITIIGGFEESHYRSAARGMKGFVSIAEEVRKGW